MAAILRDRQTGERVLLEEGVTWVFGGSGELQAPAEAGWHRMLVSGTDGRFGVRDELYTVGYCCNHCSGDIDETPQAYVNEVPVERGWIRGGDVLGFGPVRWDVEITRGPASPVGDLFRIAPPGESLPFGELLRRFEQGLEAAAAGGLLRFAHAPPRQAAMSTALLRVMSRADRSDVALRTAMAALALALSRVGAIPGGAAEPLLREIAGDASYDRWLRISALAVLGLDERSSRWIDELRRQVMDALEEGDAPAAVSIGCETLALVLEDEPLCALGEAARAVVSDASARKRRAIAISVLVAIAERDPESARALLRAAADPTPQVRLAAARALPRLPSLHAANANGALLALLCDENDEVFEEAFAALFGSNPPRIPATALLAEVDRAANDPVRIARLTQALDRLG